MDLQSGLAQPIHELFEEWLLEAEPFPALLSRRCFEVGVEFGDALDIGSSFLHARKLPKGAARAASAQT